MSIFEDDGAKLNEKALQRQALALQGVEIGVEASAERKRQRGQNKNDADLQAILLHQDHMAALYLSLLGERDRIIEEIARLSKRQTALQKQADAIAYGRLPKLEEDGSLKDDNLEALLTRYEAECGHRVDRADGGLILSIIIAEQERIRDQQTQKSQDLEEIEQKIIQTEQELGAEQSLQLSDRHFERSAAFQTAQKNDQAFDEAVGEPVMEFDMF